MAKHRMIQYSIWGHPGESMNTQYGQVTLMQWLELEQERIKKDTTPRVTEILSKPITGEVALFVDDLCSRKDYRIVQRIEDYYAKIKEGGLR